MFYCGSHCIYYNISFDVLQFAFSKFQAVTKTIQRLRVPILALKMRSKPVIYR